MSMTLIERRGSVAILTLNNPAQYNALAADLLRDFARALDDVQKDAGVRAILLTGAGKGFCSGAQFGGDTFGRGDSVGDMMRQSVNPIVDRIRHSNIPAVVAVNGPAAGAGVGIALAGDIVIAARSARFILSFARLGAALDAGTSLFLQRAIGVVRARALALTAEPLPAETAAEWGLIWKCVDDAALFDEALALAQKLAEGPPVALGLIRAQLDAAWTADLATTLDAEATAQTKAFVTADLREGAAAFMEKRAPNFVGR